MQDFILMCRINILIIDYCRVSEQPSLLKQLKDRVAWEFFYVIMHDPDEHKIV